MGKQTQPCPECYGRGDFDTYRSGGNTCRRCGGSGSIAVLSKFDHERHVCAPNPIECTLCHGDGTGGVVWRVQSFDPTGERHDYEVFVGEDAGPRAIEYLVAQLARYARDGWIFDQGVIEDYNLTLRAAMHDANGLERDFECEQIAGAMA
jgi:RecJ-like exonuclease